jgi:hypothetical protein
MDEESRKQKESDVERKGPGGLLEVPPVIIKGGSMEVEFFPDFDDDDNKKKVKKVKHPHDTKIVKVVIEDYHKNELNSYRIPPELHGKCLIFIVDDAV